MINPAVRSAGDIPANISRPERSFFEKLIDNKVSQTALRVFECIKRTLSSICDFLYNKFYAAYRERLQFRLNEKSDKGITKASLSIGSNSIDNNMGAQPVTVAILHSNAAGEQQEQASKREFDIPAPTTRNIPNHSEGTAISDQEITDDSPSSDSAPIDNTVLQPVTVVMSNSDETGKQRIYINHILVYFEQSSEMVLDCTDQHTQSIETIVGIPGHPNLVKIIETKLDGKKNTWQVDIHELHHENPNEVGEITIGSHLFYSAKKIA